MEYDEFKHVKLQGAALLALDVLSDPWDVPEFKRKMAIESLIEGLRASGYDKPRSIPVTDSRGRFTGIWRGI